MKKKNKNKGILFWITGLSGAGKTSLANGIKKEIKKKRKKKLYLKKINEIVGMKIKPQFPKKPNIIIVNDFKKNINKLSKILVQKIIK